MPNKSKQNTTKSNKPKSKLTPATNNTPDNTDNINKREKPVDKKFALVVEKPATTGEMALANREEKLGTGNVSKNPYVEVVQKRLRSLGKRRMKHLQYEEMLRSGDQTLNPDQLQTLKLKDNVEFAIQELESIIKSLNSVENE
ncbi:7118_t:CDS:2, partial [Ambispora leptoticha]